MKKGIFLLLLLFSIQSFAQDGKFIQSQKLPLGWEYYKIAIMDDAFTEVELGRFIEKT